MSHLVDRRHFLAASLLSTSAIAWGQKPAPSAQPTGDLAWFLIGDTHYLADIDNTDKMQAYSQQTNRALIETLNKLPGTELPESIGGGKVAQPAGLIHAGDVIDTGDKNGAKHEAMQQTEIANYAADYGLTGKDGRLKIPVYEVHGNHDSPHGQGHAINQIIARNKNRPGLVNLSSNGMHYSWDWHGVHFVNVGIVVGQVAEYKRRRRYNPLDSLEFLNQDLEKHVGSSGRPVVITHHVDMLRYAKPIPADEKSLNDEWDPADVSGYYAAIKSYNVIAIQYGHTHARNVYQWDGTNKTAKSGVQSFNVDNSAHYASKAQAAFYFQLTNGELIVREFSTTDRWETMTWTPQVWRSKVQVPA